MPRHDNYPARDFQSHRPADRRGEAVDGPWNRSPVTRKNARNHPRQRADQRRWPRRHRSDRVCTSVAQQRANARKDAATASHSRHSTWRPNPRQSWEKLTRNRSPLTGRSTSMLPMTGLPSSTGFIHARWPGPAADRRRPGQDRQAAADAIRNPSRCYGRMRRMRRSRFIETVR